MRFLNWRTAPIVAVALLLTLPAILLPPMTHDSFWIDWVWTEQFTSELARGNPYPRWLPQSHDGLGSPVFYYYPPLAFYVTGIFGLAGFSTYASITAAFSAGFLGSGIAMYLWLRESAKAPVIGALLFMAAPYHILDYYSRGALAEFLAIALIPLVALGVRRASQRRIVLGALAYAAIILTHLPLALLVSLFFVAPYALHLSWRAPRTMVPIAVSLLLGIAVSAIYLVPSLALDPFRDSARLWGSPGLTPDSWSLLNWAQPGPRPSLKLMMAAIILVLLQPVVLLLFTAQRIWGLYAGLCCFVVAGFVPGLWALPLLEAVQFPYRLLPLVEFAIATGLAHAAIPRLIIYAATLPLFGLSALYSLTNPIGVAIPVEKLAQYPDVVENLPPGERPDEWLSEWALALSKSHPKPKQINGYTVDRVFYFPAWKVECQGQSVATFPEARTKLLTYKGTDCGRHLVMTAPERIGALVSAVALLVILALGGSSRFGFNIQTWLRRRKLRPIKPEPAGTV